MLLQLSAQYVNKLSAPPPTTSHRRAAPRLLQHYSQFMQMKERKINWILDCRLNSNVRVCCVSVCVCVRLFVCVANFASIYLCIIVVTTYITRCFILKIQHNQYICYKLYVASVYNWHVHYLCISLVKPIIPIIQQL